MLTKLNAYKKFMRGESVALIAFQFRVSIAWVNDAIRKYKKAGK